MANLPFFVSGVRGGDLTERIETNMAGRRRIELTRARRAALAFGALSFTAVPVVVGALTLRPQGGQSAQSPRLQFEVASIKRTPDSATSASFGPMPGGRIIATNNPPANFIGNAYGVPRYRIANVPDWLTSERFDLDARAADVNATSPQLMLMLQSLLEDRFKLRAHRETRQGPVYVLSVARGGHKLRASSDSGCILIDTSKALPATAPGTPRLPWCGNNLTTLKGPNLAWNAVHIDMAGVADQLAAITRRTVIDKTGGSGVFDIDIELPPLQPAAGADDPVPTAGVSPFTVLREQLGLILEPGQGPVEYFVIDSVARPTEN